MLGLLFLRPDESFHGREVARRTGLSAGTVTRELRRLAEVGLLERESRGNQVVYRANRGSPVFEEVAGILRKTSGLADELARALAPFSDDIRVAFVFGSMAGGSQQVGSDVDVIVIGETEFGTVVDALYPLQKQLGREINPKVFAARHIADSKVTAISGETRFVSAYTAIRMLADVGLNASGYRARSSVPGHHLIAIRALGVTFGVALARYPSLSVRAASARDDS